MFFSTALWYGICRRVVGDRFLVHFVISFLMLCILDVILFC